MNVQAALTKQQIACLRLVAEGFSSKQISLEMHIHEATVNEHLQEAKKRLDANNRVEAVVKAIKIGLISLQ